MHSPTELKELRWRGKKKKRKKAIFTKKFNEHYEHHIVAIEEHIRVVLFSHACKSKCIVRSMRRRIFTFGAFS
jgi:hypothetical protein